MLLEGARSVADLNVELNAKLAAGRRELWAKDGAAALAEVSYRRTGLAVSLGAILLVGSLTAYMFYWQYYVSVWCFFAGVLSVIVFLYFKNPRRNAQALGATRSSEAL